MKKHIALGMGLLLTLGTAVGGSFLYGSAAIRQADVYEPSAKPLANEVTPDRIAMWKASAASAEYVVPKRPI